LERKIPDRVPTFELAIDSQVIDSIIAGADIYDFVEKFGLDAIVTKPDNKKVEIEKNTFKDERGSILKKGKEDYLIPTNIVIKDEKDLKRFEFPDIKAPHRFSSMKRVIERFKSRIAIVVNLRDGFSEARILHGFEQTLIDLVDRPSLIRGIVEKAVDYYSELGKIAAKMGVEIAVTGDDYAGTGGMLMSREHFKEVVYPAMKRLFKNLHNSGLYVIKHSDGNLYPIIDLLVDAGIDCLNPIDPIAGMSLEKVKREYGDKICLMGNVNCAGNLVFGNKNEVIEEVKKCLEIGAPGGGYIISSSNSIHRSVNPENYEAMLEAIKKYGKYLNDKIFIKDY